MTISFYYKFIKYKNAVRNVKQTTKSLKMSVDWFNILVWKIASLLDTRAENLCNLCQAINAYIICDKKVSFKSGTRLLLKNLTSYNIH